MNVMNHTAIDYTARIAAAHRADVAAGVRAALAARRFAESESEFEGTAAPEARARRRHVWARWIPSARAAH